MPRNPAPTANSKNHPVSLALRSEDLLPLPRLWVGREAMEEVLKITDRYRNKVNTIRARVYAEHPELDVANEKGNETPIAQQALHDKDAAWAAYERMRS